MWVWSQEAGMTPVENSTFIRPIDVMTHITLKYAGNKIPSIKI